MVLCAMWTNLHQIHIGAVVAASITTRELWYKATVYFDQVCQRKMLLYCLQMQKEE